MRHAAFAVFCQASVGLAAAAADFQRDLSTDRPDATESPYTVEAGRWQAEIEPLRWSRDGEDGVRVETLTAGAVNLKYGLAANADLQLVLEPYVRERVRPGAGLPAQTRDGFGDTVVRTKINLHGNDTAGPAWAVMPFVKLPTADDDLGNGNLEGGVIVPLAFALNERWGCGLMGELDVIRNAADDGYRAAVVTTATIAGEIAPGIGLFFELANEAPDSDASTWATTFNTGVTIALSRDVQFDTGVYLGLTRPAEDVATFAGLSCRW